MRIQEPRDLFHMIEKMLEMEDGLLCKSMVTVKIDESRGSK